jgi:hypothetical protein
VQRSAPDPSFLEDFLVSEYYYTHSEPHRRRPSIVRFPLFVVHTATYYEDSAGEAANAEKLRSNERTLSSEGRFLAWLMQFNSASDAGWSRPQGASERKIEASSLEMLSKYSETNGEYFLEMVHASAPDVLVRIEAHREYFSITLLAPIRMVRGEQALIGAPAWREALDKVWPDEFQDLEKGALHQLYNTFDRALFPVDRPDPGNPFHMLFGSVVHDPIKRDVEHFPQLTFANFRGAVLPPDWLGEGASKALFESIGSVRSERRQEVSIYLWKKRDEFKHGVFESGDKDVVASYFQGGQALYLSSLGSQPVPDSREELRYLLMYDARELPAGIDRRAWDRHRLSRLVFRINTIGTLRLAALRDLRQLRKVGEQLKGFEIRLEQAAHKKGHRARDRALLEVIGELEDIASPESDPDRPVPIFYRTARSAHYSGQMRALLEDLDEELIVGWQSYGQFVHRRVQSSLEYAASLGGRINSLWGIARTRMEFLESRALLTLERVSHVVVPVTVAGTVAGVLPDDLPESIGLKSPPVDFNLGAFFALWLIALLAWEVFLRMMKKH